VWRRPDLPEVAAHESGAFASGGEGVAQLGGLDEVFHVAETLAPAVEFFAGQRAAGDGAAEVTAADPGAFLAGVEEGV
jgi:hypothetical protein